MIMINSMKAISHIPIYYRVIDLTLPHSTIQGKTRKAFYKEYVGALFLILISKAG